MKGIVLAGGTGSRLRPLTRVTNKHLLLVGINWILYIIDRVVWWKFVKGVRGGSEFSI